LVLLAWTVTAAVPQASNQSPSGFVADSVVDSVTEWNPADLGGPEIPNVGQAPPDQIIDRGACPYEMCRYGERWLARQDVSAFAAPPERFGAPQESLGMATVIRKGT
jgi:hypothetical protein